MAILTGLKKLYSGTARRKFGPRCEYGCVQHGAVSFGVEPIKVTMGKYGEVELSGIYKKVKINGKFKCFRLRYYIPKDNKTEVQLAQRQAVRDGVLAWQSLTNSQKLVYNERAKGSPRSGYNIFMKEYLLSH